MRSFVGLSGSLIMLAACAEAPPLHTAVEPAPAAAVLLPPRPPERAAIPAEMAQIRRVQLGLKALGFDPGSVDGVLGTRTLDAIAAARAELDLPEGGETSRLAQALDAALRERTRTVQRHLAALGYGPGPPDGTPGPRTWQALQGFQADHGLPEDRTLSSGLVRQLAGIRQAGTREMPDRIAEATEAAAPGAPDRASAVLRPGDWIAVSVATLDGTRPIHVAVDDDGSIALPDLGRFQAEGRSIPALEKSIAVALLDRYLAALHVSVTAMPTDGAVAARPETAE